VCGIPSREGSWQNGGKRLRASRLARPHIIVPNLGTCFKVYSIITARLHALSLQSEWKRERLVSLAALIGARAGEPTKNR
jgi:hypothetical protein